MMYVSSKNSFLASAAIVTVLMFYSTQSYADCGAGTANGNGGISYVLAGDETNPCNMADNDTLSVTETGSITVAGNAVIATGTGISIANTGTVEATGGDFAIEVSNADPRAVVTLLTNYGGTITADGGPAVHAYKGTIITLDNTQGTIHSNTSSGISTESQSGEEDDPDNGAITTLINAFGTISTITGTAFGNAGTINTLNNDNGTIISTGANAYGFANDGIVITMTNNGGLIKSTGNDSHAFANSRVMTIFDNTNGTIEASGSNSDAMLLLTGFANPFINTDGLIKVSSEDSRAIFINADIGGITIKGGTIINTSASNDASAIAIAEVQTGAINFDNVRIIADGDTPGSGNGFALGANDNTDVNFMNGTVVRGDIVIHSTHMTVSNSSIIGDVDIQNGSVLVFNNSSLTGNLLEGGSVEFQTDFTTGGQMSSNDALNVIVGENSTTTINHALLLEAGDVTIRNGGTIFLNHGNITSIGNVINHGTIKIGSDRTLTVNSLDAATDGRITYIAANNEGALTTGSIVTQDAAADFSSQAIHINYLGTGLLDTSTKSLIAMGAEQAIAPEVEITDDSYLYDFFITQDDNAPNNLYIAAQENQLSAVSINQNHINAAHVLLNDLRNTDDATIIEVQTNLARAQNRTAYNNVVEAMQPSVNRSAITSAQTVTTNVFNVINNQMMDIKTGGITGVASGESASDLNVWGQGFGAHGTQGRRQDIAGYDVNTFGSAVGIDTGERMDRAIFGISVAYGNSHVDSKGANSSDANIDTYQATGYGSYHFDQNVTLSGMVALGLNKNSETRHDVGGIEGLNANANYNSYQAATRWSLERPFKTNSLQDFMLVPSVTVDYLSYYAKGYTETGAEGANLQVESQKSNNVNLGFGVQAQWLIKNNDQTFYQPNIHVGYTYDVTHDSIDTTSSFVAGGGTFKSDGFIPSSSTFNIGTGIKFYSADSWSFSGAYDYTYKSDYHANAGIIKAEYSF